MKLRKLFAVLVAAAMLAGFGVITSSAASPYVDFDDFTGMQIHENGQYVGNTGIQRMGWSGHLGLNFTGTVVEVDGKTLKFTGGTTAKGFQIQGANYAANIDSKGMKVVGNTYTATIEAAAVSGTGTINLVPDNHPDGVAKSFDLTAAKQTFSVTYELVEHQYNDFQVSSDVDFILYSIKIADAGEEEPEEVKPSVTEGAELFGKLNDWATFQDNFEYISGGREDVVKVTFSFEIDADDVEAAAEANDDGEATLEYQVNWGDSVTVIDLLTYEGELDFELPYDASSGWLAFGANCPTDGFGAVVTMKLFDKDDKMLFDSGRVLLSAAASSSGGGGAVATDDDGGTGSTRPDRNTGSTRPPRNPNPSNNNDVDADDGGASSNDGGAGSTNSGSSGSDENANPKAGVALAVLPALAAAAVAAVTRRRK